MPQPALRRAEPAAPVLGYASTFPTPEMFMHLTIAYVTPLVALIAGILILIMPRLLNYVVAIYLIIVGVMGLNAIHHFIR
jgi:DUF3096 family protein